MKIFLKIIIIFLSFYFAGAFAGGGIAHMFIAEESIAQITDPRLRHILQDNIDEYLVGAHYPDSGYVPGTGYGEDSHGDLFIYTFAKYIHKKYQDPITENPKLVAFLMGCAAHRVSDEIIHFTFYKDMAEHDFNNHAYKTHKYGDVGIDLLLNIDKKRWQHQPNAWWVPVHDLVNIYHLMDKNEYTADKIILGNRILSMAGFFERAMSIPLYSYLRLRMPWTAKHYYDWPNGGMVMNSKQVAAYQNDLWERIMHTHDFPTKHITKKYHYDLQMMQLSKEILEKNIARIIVKLNSDSSIELQQPVILNNYQFESYLEKLFD